MGTKLFFFFPSVYQTYHLLQSAQERKQNRHPVRVAGDHYLLLESASGGSRTPCAPCYLQNLPMSPHYKLLSYRNHGVSSLNISPCIFSSWNVGIFQGPWLVTKATLSHPVQNRQRWTILDWKKLGRYYRYNFRSTGVSGERWMNATENIILGQRNTS